MNVRLYEHPLSPYAQKVKIALREKTVPFEPQTPLDPAAGGWSKDLIEASPRIEVPALVDGGVRIFDSTIILEYIEETWPEPALLPRDPAQRARLRMIEDVCDTQYEAINWGVLEIHYFRRGEGAVADRLRATAARQTAAMHRWLEGQIGGRDWFNGESFGWGDLSVGPYVQISAWIGNPPAEGSALAAWLARIRERPSVSRTFEEAEATLPQMPEVAKLVEQGLFKREYRDHRLEWMIRSGGIDVVLDGLEKDNIRFTPDFG